MAARGVLVALALADKVTMEELDRPMAQGLAPLEAVVLAA
jgi:hypothetical protein